VDYNWLVYGVCFYGDEKWFNFLRDEGILLKMNLNVKMLLMCLLSDLELFKVFSSHRQKMKRLKPGPANKLYILQELISIYGSDVVNNMFSISHYPQYSVTNSTQKDNLQTALQSICFQKKCHLNIVKFLIRNGSRVDPDNSQISPLAAAVIRSKRPIIFYLLSQGASCQKARDDLAKSQYTYKIFDLNQYFKEYCQEITTRRLVIVKCWKLCARGRVTIVEGAELAKVFEYLFRIPSELTMRIIWLSGSYVS